MKFLHTADWQLGMTRHFLDEDAQARYTAARIDAIKAIGLLAEQEHCDFVLVCGDVFETNDVARSVVSRTLEAMRSISVPIFLLPGNHDPLDASSIYTSTAFVASCPPQLTVLRTPGRHEVSPGLEIVAAPWFSKRPLTDLTADALTALPADGTVRILAAHGGTDLLDPDQTNPALIHVSTLETALAEGSIHYAALGDKHSVTQVGSTGKIWYSGTQEVTSFREKEPGKVLLVELDVEKASASKERSVAKVSPQQIGVWAFLDLAADLNNSSDLAELEKSLSSVENKDRTVLRLSLKGTLSLPEKAALDNVLAENALRFASLQIWDRHTDLQVYVAGNELAELGVSGFAADAVAELTTASRAEGSGAHTAQNALSLLFRLAGGSAGAGGSIGAGTQNARGAVQ